MEEKEFIEKMAETGRVMAEATMKQDKENKRLWTLVIVQSVFIAIMAICMVWGVYNFQRTVDDALWKALNSVGEVTTTTTTNTVTQDTGEGTGNNVYQAEGGTYNESGVE